MKKIFSIFAVTLLFLFAQSVQAIDVEKVKKGVVRLFSKNARGKNGSGTGFFITENGWIVTNSHVVTDVFKNRLQTVILMKVKPLKVVQTRIVKDFSGEGVDLALLKADLTGVEPLPWVIQM